MKRYYEKAFVRKQQLLAEYTNRIVALNNQHYKEIEDLCREII